MSELFRPESLIALLSLASLEIVLGIDNVVFIAILSGKLPAEEQVGQKGAKPGLSGKANGKGAASFSSVIAQILLLDLVFSVDSVLTAIGMVDPSRYQSPPFPGTNIPWPPLVIMIVAVLLAIGVMLVFARPLSKFIENHPTMKMLALSFLLLIGAVLVAEGLHQHIPRGYIYFSMGFSLFVEILNLKLIKRRPPRPTMETVARALGEKRG